MESNRVQINSIVESQLPSFVKEDYPLVSELLTEYYRSLESKGSSYDILQNIDQYVEVNNISNLIESTVLTSNVDFFDETINVSSTEGFPKTYGLISIGNEILLYKSKTSTSFLQCVRGFSGVTSYSTENSEDLTFSQSEIESHLAGSNVKNLSSLFLVEFFNKVKKQFLYGFDNRELFSGLNQNIFLKQSKDFYSSKGTDRSFEILFRVLYGKDVDVILPRDYLFQPSNAQYRVTRNLVVEPIGGNIESLLNKTIFQNQYQDIPKSFGSVTDIQRILKNGKEYYTLMLDYDFDKDVIVSGSIFGNLKIHPKTSILNDIPTNSQSISVDSTIGFPKSGELVVSVNDQEILINYEGKTVNQFLNCTGITQEISRGTSIYLNTYAYGYASDGNEIRFRITGVVSNTNIPENTVYYEKGDIGKILTFGYYGKEILDNNWIFNTTVKCEVSNFYNNGGFKYIIETNDNNGIYAGDSVEIDYINSSTGFRETGVINGPNVTIPTGSVPGKSFQIETDGYLISNIFSVKRLVSNFSDTNFSSDVLNVYQDFDDKTKYVASSSLPFYGSNPNPVIEDYNIILSGSFGGEILKIVDDNSNHGFLTGDSVVYSNRVLGSNTLGISTGVYFVKKISDNEIKLCRSRSDIDSQKFVSISSTSISGDNNIISLLKFTNKNIPSFIDSQRIIRSIKNPENDGKIYDTNPGTTGILINGVEVLNYKSSDFIYYGPIEKIDVLSPGRNIDVVNPPILEVSSGIGTTSSVEGFCGVEGSLLRVDIIDGGFDYLDEPIVTISGGGGSGASAMCKLLDYDYSISFNPKDSSRINLVENQIGFSTYHKFFDGESVIYKTSGNTPIGGLSTDAKYFVRVINDNAIKLHKNHEESLVGINTVDLTSFGLGNHRFNSTRRKRKINSIIVKNSGSGYKNKKISVSSSGINTSNNTINVYENPYFDRDIIYYYGGDENISGLSTGKYIATRVDENSFKLSNIGVGTTSKYFYYETKQYVNFKSKGSGNHIFNYEPIEVTISGKLGISTISNVDINAKIIPVFRGELKSVFVYDGGVGYGSSEIINYNKQPTFSLKAGSGARVTPIISNGRIVDVIVTESGSGYNSQPDLIVRGSGVGAILTPTITNGRITKVNVINGGINYDQKNTIIDVIVPATGYEIKSYPKTWTINKFKRLLDSKKITLDDGVVYEGINPNYGLQYTHLYSPRSLRKKVFTQNFEIGNVNYRSDYENDFIEEKYHSPLIGWAYDGNPIYGPYGYDSPDNKDIRQILSGYPKPVDSQPNRPSKKLFPAGYFVEDFVYDDSGDLDEHNGRFCVTPEFPYGTYAYFMTLSEIDSNQTTGDFAGDKEPKFPYVIGKSYKSKPLSFNYDVKSNQEDFDFTTGNVFRNTYPYNTLSQNSSYEYFLNSDYTQFDTTKVTSITAGSVDSIKIISGGTNYKVNDRLVFGNENTDGRGVSSKVEFIKGEVITGISQTSTVISDIEFYPVSSRNEIVAFSTSPHDLNNGDIVYIDSLTNYDSSLQNSFKVGVRSDNYILNLGVGDASVTGIVTYFYISGLLEDRLRENDILKIGSEEIKVLNIDSKTSRIRVLREQNSTVSSAHSSYSFLYENPRKFTINSNIDIKNKEYRLNKEIYFNPSESLGIGTVVGLGHTIVFSNPGVGISSILIPTKSIFIENHNLETGDELVYKNNGGISITVSNGLGTFGLENNSIIYAAKISTNLVGISTIKVGLGTTGDFVGITENGSTLFLTDIGSGDYHSFTTRHQNVSKGNVSKTIVTVSTATTHLLSEGDDVFINALLGVTTSFVVKYSDYHRKLVINPRDFSDVDIVDNLITINDHGYDDGQKLIHTSTSPSSGLEDQAIYYAIVYDKDRIKLSNSYYDATYSKKEINITSSSFGTLSPINPNLKVTKNQRVVFDLSDSSLSELSSGIGRTSSFNFDLFLDSNFENKFFSVDVDGISLIEKSANIGIETNSYVSFSVNDSFPNQIYYNLLPITNLSVKNEILSDNEVVESNKITFIDSDLNGKKQVIGISSQTFDFQNSKPLNFNSYSSSDGTFDYYTSSTNARGEIYGLKILSGGNSYKKLPSITSISSGIGSGAILIPQSTTIGKISNTSIENIGFNYSVDTTLKPLVKFPSILRVEPLSTLDFIGVSFPGLNYNTSPDLIVIDGFTNKVVNDIVLDYSLELNQVSIIRNTKGLYSANPRIIAVNNSNGLGISSISYNNSNKIVTVVLSKQFSDSKNFPLSIGDKILVEGVSTIEETSKGYNSSNYNYETFSIVGVTTSEGGSGATVQYSLESYLSSTESPGTFDPNNSSATIIPERYLPRFNINLSKNNFILGEKVTSETKSGIVLKFDENNEYITLETVEDFSIDSLILGETSKSQAFVREVLISESFDNIESSSIVKGGWNTESGFLNNDLQRVQDSDYYQYFSYSLKSEVSFNEWNDVVSNLNHTLGFKKFSDLIVKSLPNNSGITTIQNEGSFTSLSDLNSIVDIDCISDYDLVSENSFYIDDKLTSDEIEFNSAILQDYSESSGNRVLIIDDISQDFNTSISRSYVTSFNI